MKASIEFTLRGLCQMLKNGVRYFMAVVQHGTIRAAAAELNIAQSAVSRQIQALEYELGVPLLERRPRGVELTHAGELLFSYGRDASYRGERLLSELDALQGLRRGHVRLGSVEALVPHLLPEAIDRFLTQFPKVTFAVEIAGTDRVVAAVKDGSVDIGLGFSPDPAREVQVMHRTYQPLYAMVTRYHPLARLGVISVKQIVEYPVAVPTKNTGSRSLFDQVCRQAHVYISPALETNSVELLHRFALVGHGVSLLTGLSCVESVRSGELVPVKFAEETLSQGHIDILTLAGRRLPIAVEKFLSSLRNALDALPSPLRDAN